jgi:hypothetical protein
MSIERNALVADVVLSDLVQTFMALEKSVIHRKRLLAEKDYRWKHIRLIAGTEELIAVIAQEMISTVAFAKEFGLGDYEIVKTLIENVTPEKRPGFLRTVESGFNLSPEEKSSLLVASD